MPTERENIERNGPDPSRYPIEVFYSEEDGGFIAIAKDLPGCSAFGKTQAEALAEVQHAIDAWQQAATAVGNPIPEPSRDSDETSLPSGKILLRVPRSLHASLIECAKREAASLNQHLVSVLSVSVGKTLVREVPIMTNFSFVRYGVGVATPVLLGGGMTTITVGGGSTVIRSLEMATVVRPIEALDLTRLPANLPVVEVR